MSTLLALLLSFVGAIIAGIVVAMVSWRTHRGDFYKAVAEEKSAENEKLTGENERLKQLTDVTPILQSLADVAEALARHADTITAVFKTTAQVFEKVGEMNGSLRANTVAMEALAERLILDEAARGLLDAASKTTSSGARRRRAP